MTLNMLKDHIRELHALKKKTKIHSDLELPTVLS